MTRGFGSIGRRAGASNTLRGAVMVLCFGLSFSRHLKVYSRAVERQSLHTISPA